MRDDHPTSSSTNQVKTHLFKAHGQVDMHMEGNLLQYVAVGPFNKELCDCLAIAQLEFLQSLHPSGPWASICTVKESAMGGPDSVARYAELMHAPKPPGLTPVATAFVIDPQVEGGRLMEPFFAQIYADIQRPFRIFETMEEARVWAQTMISQAAPD